MSIPLKPYPEYKDTPTGWLGDMPTQWKGTSLRALTRVTNKRGQPNLQMLSVYREYGVIRRDSRDDNHNAKGEDLSAYKVVRPGDLVLNKMKTWQGSLGVSDYEGIVSPAYIVCSLIGEFNRTFLHFVLRSRPYIDHYNSISFGVRIGQWDMRYQDFKQVPVYLPPLHEQEVIVRFLISQERNINRLIRAKRQLITLLNEQKQAIIQRAVTRGLDSDASLKHSGVEWLGDIPEHWTGRRLKYLVCNVNEIMDSKGPGDIYLALEHVQSWTGQLKLPDEEVTFESSVKRFRSGDILFGKLRPYLAKVTRPSFSGVCVGEFLVLRLINDNVLPTFLEQRLRSSDLIQAISSSTFGAKMPRADWSFIGNLVVHFPSTLNEQEEIVYYLGQHTSGLDKTVERTEREIDLIREYRTRLIADVVTGKLDVRGMQLPDVEEALDLTPLDDIEVAEDGEVEELQLEPAEA